MAKHCTNCGEELKESYKFCPGCGEVIKPDEIDVNENGEKGKIEIIVCDNCGTENLSDDNICKQCGVPLKEKVIKKVVSEKETSFQTKYAANKLDPASSKKKQSKKKRKPAPTKEINSHSKEIDSKKIYLIASVIAIFVVIVLLSTGVFDSNVPVDRNPNSGGDQSTGSGIDLNSLQRINDLETRLNSNPDDLNLLLELAHLKNDSGFYENAITLYQRYLDKKPDNSDARIDMGVCYYNIGNYETAIFEMKKALEYQPKHQIGHLNLGIVNLTAGNVDEAKSWFQKALELGPDTDVGKKAQELLNSHSL
ncbi:tetratricopeptide repeat protein [Bacteroidota bacterium]